MQSGIASIDGRDRACLPNTGARPRTTLPSSAAAGKTMVQSAGHPGQDEASCNIWGTEKRVLIQRDPNQGIGISLVGGKVEVNGGASSISGVFIKSVVAKSPAERTGQLFTGDRILEIDGVDLRNAGFERATQIIKQAGNEICLIVQSLKNIPFESDPGAVANNRKSNPSSQQQATIPTDGSSSTLTSQAASPAPSSRRESLMPPSKGKDGYASDAESAVSAETLSPSPSDSDSSSDEEDGGRVTSRRGAEIDRMSAGHVKLTKVEKQQASEEEDEYGYTMQKIRKRYGHMAGELHLVGVGRNPKLGGLGISLAGHKDRSRMGVLVAGVNPKSSAHQEGKILVGDEILEVNGTVVRGRCHLNVSSTIRQIRTPLLKFVILRKKEDMRLDDLAVGPIVSYPVSFMVQQAMDSEALLSSLTERYKGVRAVRVQKGDSGGGLGIMIIEGRHAAMGQGIFISDIQKGSPAQEAGLSVGDIILYADTENLMGAEYDKAVAILRRITGTVTLYVCNPNSAATGGGSNELQLPRAVSPAPGSPNRPSTPAGTQGTLSPMAASSPTPSGRKSPDARNKADHTIVPGNDASIELSLGEKLPLGMHLIGERESPLGGVYILDIRPNGLVAKDGRLRVGDQLKEVGSINLREKTAKEAYEAIWQAAARGTKLPLLIHRRHSDDDDAHRFEELALTLSRRKEKCLGLCIQCPKSGSDYPLVTDILDGSLAFLDGKLVKGDRILTVNSVDLTGATPEKAASALRAAFTFAAPTMTFKVRRLRKP